MGHNFLGINEVVNYYCLTYSTEQLEYLAKIPFSEATLRECKDTHLLVAGYPMTLGDPRLSVTMSDNFLAKKEKVGLRWYLIRKTAVEKSFSKTFGDQQRLLGPKDEVPRACELIYAVKLCFMATGEQLFENIYVRCIDQDGGARAYVGNFGSVYPDNAFYYYGDYPEAKTGLASARKPDK
jgi:hypothetical protein